MKSSRCSIAIYSVDPPALSAFHAFDPESYVLITTINDGLIHIDVDGNPAPSLATSWERTSPTTWEFELRGGVEFTNGEPFDADSVVATFAAHQSPTPSALGGGILGSIAAVTKLDTHRVQFETAFPDAMFLRRLFFSSIYPAKVLAEQGRDVFAEAPIGTGAYRLESWEKGREIVLARNPKHWAGRATIDELRFPIVRQKWWPEYLEAGLVDMALNIDSHDATRLEGAEGVSVEHAPAAVSQWFLWNNEGPLADVRVRRALNHAVHRPLIVEVAEHGHGRAQTSIATAESEGYEPDVTTYPYNPELAKSLLAEAGYEDGFTLRGVVSETSTTVFLAVQEFLARIGVRLEGEIMPRSEWIGRVVVPRLMGGTPYDGDFGLVMVDNPVLDSLFHQFIFFFSQSPWTFTQNETYDAQFLKAATAFEEETPGEARRELERYVSDQALLLFTVQQHVYAAFREGFHLPLPKSGHFNTEAFWDARCDADLARPAKPEDLVHYQPESPDMTALLEATSHVGTFFLRDGSEFSARSVERIWKNVSTSEERWRLQTQPMMRTLVAQVEAKNNLASILDSTERSAIVGYSTTGQRLFVNEGYRRMIGVDEGSAFELIDAVAGNPRSEAIRQHIDAAGSWVGTVLVPMPDEEGLRHFHLTLAAVVDETGAKTGYTFVFSDFSGAEERIRSQAIRTILDNVPYGLLMVDSEHRVLEGYSRACDALFTRQGEKIEGETLEDLLGLDERLRAHFGVMLDQIFDDIFPEEVALDQLPKRLSSGDRWVSVSASVIRGDGGEVAKVLFNLLDISELIEAERSEERMRGVLKVLQHKESFAGFARSLDAALDELLRDTEVRSQGEMRRALHTAKGVLAQFSLNDLARRIHEIEDEPSITLAHLREVREAMHELLEENAAVWDISHHRRDADIIVRPSALKEIRAKVGAASSLEAAKELLGDAFLALEEKPFGVVAGPLRESCELHAAKRGKPVHFEIVGEEVAVPSRYREALGCITHLLRNSVDHGVETRAARGDKPPVPTIRVEVDRGDGLFRVAVVDDGRGIDGDALSARAVASGMLDAAAVAEMSEREKQELLFEDTLSTAEEITDTSGRGVGMAAVRAAVEAVAGRVLVESARGEGTRMELVFPDPRSAVRDARAPSHAPSA